MKKQFEEAKRILVLTNQPKFELVAKLLEEAGELAQVVNKSEKYPKLTKYHIAEEAADTIICVLALLNSFGVGYEDLIEQLEEKMIKWGRTCKAKESAQPSRDLIEFEGYTIVVSKVSTIGAVQTFSTGSMICDWDFGFMVYCDSSVGIQILIPTETDAMGNHKLNKIQREHVAEKKRQEFIGMYKKAIQ